MADETKAPTTERPTCEVCGKPEAVDADYDGTGDAAGLCWAEANGGHSPQNVIDVLRTTRDALAQRVGALEDERDAAMATAAMWRAECESLSTEMGLPPTIRPVEGELRRMLDEGRKARTDRDRLAAELAEVKAVLAEMHRAERRARQWDPSGPERLRAVYDALDGLAAKYANEAKQ